MTVYIGTDTGAQHVRLAAWGQDTSLFLGPELDMTGQFSFVSCLPSSLPGRLVISGERRRAGRVSQTARELTAEFKLHFESPVSLLSASWPA
ncbi:MAG: hypothetical protein LBP22_09475 [Deltaproteobacteria bacterium]|nr:hypothetical protein [Deltaproteobacteria bacterium]